MIVLEGIYRSKIEYQNKYLKQTKKNFSKS